jgi:hypothetical protein
MSAAAIFGAVMSCIFVAALWFNYHGPIPQDTSEQKDKTEQTDEKSKDKSEQQEKPEQKAKSSTKKPAKKKTEACVENCADQWPLRSLTPWPSDEPRQ